MSIDILSDARVDDRVLFLDLQYPEVRDNTRTVELGLMDVRAADSIRISYDFHRDGWSIRQDSYCAVTKDMSVADHAWREVAFIPAWQRERSSREEHLSWRIFGNLDDDPYNARARGGYARAAKLSAERRSEIAREAANARWHPEGQEEIAL